MISKRLSLVAIAIMLVPGAALAADSVTRPTVVSFAAPSKLKAGARAGAKLGARSNQQSNDDHTAGFVIAGLAGAVVGFTLNEALDNDNNNNFCSSPPCF